MGELVLMATHTTLFLWTARDQFVGVYLVCEASSWGSITGSGGSLWRVLFQAGVGPVGGVTGVTVSAVGDHKTQLLYALQWHVYPLDVTQATHETHCRKAACCRRTPGRRRFRWLRRPRSWPRIVRIARRSGKRFRRAHVCRSPYDRCGQRVATGGLRCLCRDVAGRPGCGSSPRWRSARADC